MYYFVSIMKTTWRYFNSSQIDFFDHFNSIFGTYLNG